MWTKPKTDWKQSDYFNVADYNRIKGNINALHDLAITLWPDFDIEDMGGDKTYQDYSFYADELNKFEANLDKICAGTVDLDLGDHRTYLDNTPFIQWDELNRIELACLRIYNNIMGRIDGMRSLAFTLNGGVF